MGKTYYVLSGEGEKGWWDVFTTSDIQSVLNKERCGGDRWSRAICDVFEVDGGYAGYDVDTGEVRPVPAHLINRGNE
jgi:hypothetical protein